MIVDCGVQTPTLAAQVHGLRLWDSDKRVRKDLYTPIRFVPTERIFAVDKMALAFDAVVVSEAFGAVGAAGEIIHGREFASAKVPLVTLYGPVRATLQNISRLLADSGPPHRY